MSDYEDLADRIGAKRYSMVVSLLNRVSGLDLTYDSGTFFKMAIENGNSDIVQVLLEYFEQNQLSSYKKDSYEYAILKGKLRDILEEATEYNELSSKMQDILSPYLDFSDYRLIHASAAGNEYLVTELLNNSKIDINLKEETWGNTALHFASQNSHVKVILLLVKAGVDTEITNDHGMTAKEVYNMRHVTGDDVQAKDLEVLFNPNDNKIIIKDGSLNEDTQHNLDESTQVTLEDEHSLLSESYLSKYNEKNSSDIKELKVYQAIKSLQSVYSHANDELAINIARDFGMHAGDGNATHVRIWQKGEQKIIDIDSSPSAVKGVQLSFNSKIKDTITMPEAMDCHIEGCHQLHEEYHVNLSGCEYEYMGEGF